MGLAIIVSSISFEDVNLGKVTLSGNVPIRCLYINLENFYRGTTVDLKCSYLPANTTQRDVVWSIESGSEYASISGSVLTIKSGASRNEVVVKCTSAINPNVSTEKTITVTYSDEPVVTDSDLYFPLTSNGNDVIEGISPIIEQQVEYSSSGAYFNGNDSLQNIAGLQYNISNVYKTIIATVKADNVSDEYQQYFFMEHADKNDGHESLLALGVIANNSTLQATFGYTGAGIDGSIDIAYIKETWHKVAMKATDTTVSIFMDGQKVYEHPVVYGASPTKLSIGNSWKVDGTSTNTRTFKGFLKDVKCYKNALSDEDLITKTTI